LWFWCDADLKGAGFKDPILVAATDGVGTKLRASPLMEALTASALIWLPCASTIWSRQGAEPPFLDYFATGKLELTATRIINGTAKGQNCPVARADRWGNGGNAGMHRG
jgi:phosphoribosylformylglycinamidine cyclo-ligase